MTTPPAVQRLPLRPLDPTPALRRPRASYVPERASYAVLRDQGREGAGRAERRRRRGENMRSPIVWFGGKGHLWHKILPHFPQHQTYVEPFAGGASLFFQKPPSPVEVLNDLDHGIVNFYRVLRDPEKFERFRRMAEFTPYSREEFRHCRDTWEGVGDEVERAWRWFVAIRQSFAGHSVKPSWSFSVDHSTFGRAGRVSSWLTMIDGLDDVHARLRTAQIEHADFRDVLETYDRPDTLAYLDPPYLAETRSGGGYTHEMTEQDHRDIAEILLGLKGMAILSGYQHALYQPLESAGWRRVDFSVFARSVGTTKGAGRIGEGALRNDTRTESLWINPAAQSRQQLNLFTNDEAA
jgi:DNA adenine methylase